jgi:hypothetical protein
MYYLCLVPIPSTILTLQEKQDEFRRQLLTFGDVKEMIYLPSFQRVLVDYGDDESVMKAKTSINGQTIFDDKIGAYLVEKKVVDDQQRFLNVPKTEHLFLISPPVSPPVGWEQSVEGHPSSNPNGHLDVDHVIGALELQSFNCYTDGVDDDGNNDNHNGNTQTTGIVLFASGEDGSLPVIKVENADDEINDNYQPNLIKFERTRFPSR